METEKAPEGQEWRGGNHMEEEKASPLTMQIKIDTAQLDNAIKKVNHLIDLVREARSLTDDLASRSVEVELEIKV